METVIILDEILQPNQVTRSQNFTNPQVIIFDSPSLPLDESVEFGFSLVAEFPLIGRISEKLIPVTFLDQEFNLQGNSDLIIHIPREISESNVNFYCYFNSARNLDLTVYVLKSSVTQESIFNSLEEIKTTELINDALLAGNEIAQNNALIALGLSLSPVTLGASLAIEPFLLTANSNLIPLLLP